MAKGNGHKGLHIVAWVGSYVAFSIGRSLNGTRGAVILSAGALLIYLAVWAVVAAASPGEKLHGKFLHAESRWWGLPAGLRFAVFAALAWAVCSYFAQDDYDRSMGLVLWPAVFIVGIYFGFRGFVVGPTAQQRAARVTTHLQAAEGRHPSAPVAANQGPSRSIRQEPQGPIDFDDKADATPPNSAVTDMTPAQRRQAMDALIGRMR